LSIGAVSTSKFINGVWRGSVYITQSGENRINATYDGLDGYSSFFTVNPDSRIKFITIISGNNQNGTVNETLTDSLSIKVV
jgi:hypothetical protein